MTEDQFRIRLSRFITEDKGGVNAYARELGVTPSMVSHMKTGRKQATQQVLDDMGFERVTKCRVSYRKVGV